MFSYGLFVVAGHPLVANVVSNGIYVNRYVRYKVIRIKLGKEQLLSNGGVYL
jgi:hypothetical protein